MRSPAGETACRNCGRTRTADELDRHRWCKECRQEVVRRATRAARLIAIATSLVLIAWIFVFIGSAPRFLMAWLVLVIATYFVVYTLGRRVAFEVIRGRGVPPPRE